MNNSVSATSNEAGTSSPGTASITVVAPPTISKMFGAASISLNGSTSLSFTIHNNNASSTQSGIGFSDALPAGLVISTPNGQTGTCGGGTITAVQGTSVISLTGATLAQSSSCTFSVNVTGTTAGTKNNTTTAVTSNQGGSGGTASASIAVVAPPAISAAFAASRVQLNTSTNLRFTITNPAANTVALTGVGFADTLPSGLAVSNPSVVTGSCGGGTITATANATSIMLTSATISTGSSCTFSVSVTGTADGTQNNTTGTVTSANGGTGNMATASVTVTSKPFIAAQPTNEAVCEDTKVTFTAAAGGLPTPTVHWQASFDGGTYWLNIPGATSPTLTFPAIVLANGTEYRAVFSNTFGTATTNAATLTVDFDPQIIMQPNNEQVRKGQEVTFTAAAIGRPTPTVQWQVSTNGGNTWSSISGATSTTLTFQGTAAQNGNLYRAVFTDTCGNATTRAASLHVD